MADYQLAEAGVIRLADGAFIPADVDNRDWREHLEWVVAGGVPDPAPVPINPEPTPEEIAAQQARHEAKDKAAKKLGLTSDEMDVLFGPNGDPIPS